MQSYAIAWRHAPLLMRKVPVREHFSKIPRYFKSIQRLETPWALALHVSPARLVGMLAQYMRLPRGIMELYPKHKRGLEQRAQPPIAAYDRRSG